MVGQATETFRAIGRSGLFALVGTLLFAAAAGTGSLIWRQHEQDVAIVERDAARVTNVLSSDVSARLLTVDAMLIEIGQDVEELHLIQAQSAEAPERMLAARAAAQAALARRAGLLRDVVALTVILRDGTLGGLGVGSWHDADGRIAPYFDAFVQRPELRLYIGAPILDAGTSEAAVVIARRIDHIDGTFAGIVAARVSLRLFGSTVTMAELNARDIVSIWRSDGLLIAHFPI
jgi:hypothetical protein